MVKKISAILLALVLCLSVVVFPASATAELNGTDVAFALKWDKEYYKPGDTATLNLYLAVKDDIPLYSGTITVGLNSKFISPDDNVPTECVKAGDLCASYFKDLSGETATSKSNATYQGKIEGKNTAEENATYDWYIRIALTKNVSGDHPNCGNNKDGLYGSEIDPTVPFITYTFKVASTATDGEAIPAAITSGCATCSPAQLQLKYYKTPGTGTTTASVAAAQYDVSAAVAEATVGTAPTPVCDHSADKITWKETTPATYTSTGIETGTCSCGDYTTTRPIAMKVLVSALKGQMRYNLEDDTKFDVRALAKIPAADFQAAFGDTVNAKAMIKEAGFVFASGKNITTPDMDAVKALVKDGTEVTGYAKKTITYISDSISSGNYVFSCLVTGLDEDTVSSEDQSLIAIGYIAWDADKDGVVDSYAFYPETQTIEFAKLYANKK